MSRQDKTYMGYWVQELENKMILGYVNATFYQVTLMAQWTLEPDIAWMLLRTAGCNSLQWGPKQNTVYTQIFSGVKNNSWLGFHFIILRL